MATSTPAPASAAYASRTPAADAGPDTPGPPSSVREVRLVRTIWLEVVACGRPNATRHEVAQLLSALQWRVSNTVSDREFQHLYAQWREAPVHKPPDGVSASSVVDARTRRRARLTHDNRAADRDRGRACGHADRQWRVGDRPDAHDGSVG